MINYEEVYWKAFERYERTVVIIDESHPNITIELMVSEDERRELLVVDKYISYLNIDDPSEVSIQIYHIKSRGFDNKGNLVLFTAKEIIK